MIIMMPGITTKHNCKSYRILSGKGQTAIAVHDRSLTYNVHHGKMYKEQAVHPMMSHPSSADMKAL